MTSRSIARSLRADLIACADNPECRDRLTGLSRQALLALLHDWDIWARDDQLAPDGDWTAWLCLGGRGAGKTRAGAEWIRALATGRAGEGAGRIALVGETLADVREVMVEGASGLMAVHPRSERPRLEATRRRLVWESGAVAQFFSAEDPESLRGPQFEAAWCDELAKWRYDEATWDMLQFGLRLGERPRQIVTTTPRPTRLLKRLLSDPLTTVTRARTAANAAFLAPGFMERIVGRYAGTRLGRQELDGELIEERADALWSRALLERGRVTTHPPLMRCVVAIDPPATSGPNADACGLIVAGLDEEGTGYLLEDASLGGARPEVWAQKAVALWKRFEADALIAEVNQGGEMVRSVLHQVEPRVPVTMVRATRGKWLRAEPIATLYAQGRVRHVGSFPELEDEMTDFAPNGLSGGRSPDRLDALVWALTHLMLNTAVTPSIRHT